MLIMQWSSVISRNSTHLVLISLILCISNGKVFYFAAIDIQTEISLRLQTLYNSWTNAFDPKEKVEVKVSKRPSYFFDLWKKVGPKVAYPYSL